MEPVGLSDMETGLHFCLLSPSWRQLQFALCWRYTGGAELPPSLYESGEAIVLVRTSKYLLNFTRKGKKNEGEKEAGSGVVFTCLFHCVAEKLLVCFAQTMLCL